MRVDHEVSRWLVFRSHDPDVASLSADQQFASVAARFLAHQTLGDGQLLVKTIPPSPFFGVTIATDTPAVITLRGRYRTWDLLLHGAKQSTHALTQY